MFNNTSNDLHGSFLTVAFKMILDATPVVFIFVVLTVSEFFNFLVIPNYEHLLHNPHSGLSTPAF